MRALAVALACLACAGSAQAEWYRASSKHFVIYSEQEPESLRKYAETLERFDAAVRTIRGMDDLPPSQGNRLTIFSLFDPADVARLAGDKTGLTAGFYRGRAAGSVDVASRTGSGAVHVAPKTGTRLGGGELNLVAGTGIVLLHEYSHHLMMQDVATPYPEWLIEGFAEFMSTARFEPDGVGLGLPATHRFLGLIEGEALPLETLLSGRYERINAEQRESIYGYGWLLAHYLTFEPSRKGQLETYLRDMARGTDPLEAARQAFGDLAKLKRDLGAYLNRPRLQYIKLTGPDLSSAPVSVTQLSAGGSAVLPVLVEVKNGVTAAQAEDVARRVRAVQARFPGDELVETTLAEAELDANHPETAEAAADRAIKANPRNAEAIVLKGRAIAERAGAAGRTERQGLFAEARKRFLAANSLDKEDPEPLMEFYYSFARQGVPATANAVAALHYASDLAPQDSGLRMTSALQYLSDGKVTEARRTLGPIAYDPHGGEFAQLARQVMAKVNGGDVEGALAIADAASTEDAGSR